MQNIEADRQGTQNIRRYGLKSRIMVELPRQSHSNIHSPIGYGNRLTILKHFICTLIWSNGSWYKRSMIAWFITVFRWVRTSQINPE